MQRTIFLRLLQLFCCAALIAMTTSAAPPPRTRVDLIMGGDYVVTMDPRQLVIEHGAVAIDDGAIVAVGPAAQIMATYRAKRVLPGQGQVLMPGLINGHTHLAMALFRGLADDLTLSDWLQNHIFPAEAEFVNPEFVRVGVQLACWEMIRGGTTTFVDMYFYPDAEASVIEQCGLRGVIAPSAIDFPSPGFSGWDDSFAAAVDFAERWKGKNSRIIPALGVHAPYTVSPEHLHQARDAARRLQVPISIHVAETQSEVDDVLARYGNRPVNHLNSLDVFDAQTIAAHMVYPNATENDAVNGTGLFTPENYLGDLWRFDIASATWVQIVFDPTTGPGPRDNAKLIVDDHNDRLWLFGGGTFDGTTLSDLWYFDLHTHAWTRVDPAMTGPAPAPRVGPFSFARETATAYEFFIFGGATGEFNPALLNDMWRLTIPFGADDD